MVEIYLKTNSDYSKNGDITLDPTLCTYNDIENLLTLEHFQDEEGRWKYIEFENVIAVEENEKKILYRIYNVVRSLYSVTAYARPIFYDLIDKVLIDVRPTNKLGQEALNIVLADTGFTGHSNLTTLSTSYYIRKNIVEALLGDNENSFLNRWGGEFYCENFDVYINERIGSDNGVRVEFGYNLNEIEEDVNIEEVATRIIPVGFNGITLDTSNQVVWEYKHGEITTRSNCAWVDSPIINKYVNPKTRVIEFSDVKVKENVDDEEGFNTIEEARQELIKRCYELFDNGIDKPVVNYKIDMINLANTTYYEDFKMLTTVNKGDTVICYIPHLDIDVKARVIDYEKDLLNDDYISLELGNAVDNFFNQQADVQSTVNKITNSNGSVNAGEIQGVINAIKTQFKALRDIAQPQDVRAILFEDRVEDSPTFGCMVLGTIGFEIASTFKPGTQEWDFRTFGTGQGFIADCIIAGILMSRNGISWLNLDNGTFDFAKGNLSFDGTDIQMIGKIINILNGYGVELDKGGISFATGGETVGGIRSSSFPTNRNINGLSIVNTRDGDYIDLGFTENEVFNSNAEFFAKLRISKNKNEQTGNFIGIQFLDNVIIRGGYPFLVESNDINYPHALFNSAGTGLLNIFGDNGLNLGYQNGALKQTAIQINETPSSNGSRVTVFEQVSMNGNDIRFVPNIYNSTGGKYYHDGWCGSIESTAKRISNLNAFLDSGWYGFAEGSNGAPTTWGVLLHLKLNEGSFAQLVIGTDNKIYTRWWANSWTSWVQR